jgi:UDP-glucose 4-epimerase
MKVLITGGAGFIGSTIASCLEDHGGAAIVLDDFSTGRPEFTVGRACYAGDIADARLVAQVFDEHPDITAVVHCAAKIVVPDSVADPLGYYTANVAKTVAFLKALTRTCCRRLVFSSTAAVYATVPGFMVDESSPFALTSPYAASKAMIERVLQDATVAHPLRVLSFRYFNPVGADPQWRSGLQLAEPTHALGMLLRARETGTPFTVTGTDWPTRDGTGLRDYVHVWDVAEAHVRALERFDGIVPASDPYEVINLGVGAGVTVHELVAAFGSVTGTELAVLDGPARPGDVAGSFTAVTRARELLGWRAERTLEQGIADSIEWRRRWLAHLACGGADPRRLVAVAGGRG